MSNELINLSAIGSLPPAKYDDAAFDASASGGGSFPARLQLLTSNSSKCKEGSFPTNHYALVDGQNYKDLGKNVDVLVIDWRPKALETGDDVINSHDPESEQFKRIMERSLHEKDSGCMFGVEFLVYIPAAKGFSTFFLGTKSSRRESKPLRALMGKAATLGSQKIETKKYTWFTNSVSACSTPFDLPDEDLLVAEVTRFRNPPESTTEVVAEDGRAR